MFKIVPVRVVSIFLPIITTTSLIMFITRDLLVSIRNEAIFSRYLRFTFPVYFNRL